MYPFMSNLLKLLIADYRGIYLHIADLLSENLFRKFDKGYFLGVKIVKVYSKESEEQAKLAFFQECNFYLQSVSSLGQGPMIMLLLNKMLLLISIV